jgi:hypothetical protein
MVTKMKADELEVLNGSDIRSDLERQGADREYLQKHYHDLLRKYRNQWVVISGGKLIKSENNPDRLLEALSRAPKKDMLVFYLADPEEFMLL